MNPQLFVNKQMLKEGFQSSLFDTAKLLLGYNDVNWRTHGSMIQNLESPSKRKLIVMPRGTFKSSVACVSYPIWLAINNPNIRVMIDSEVYSNSKNFIREIRQKLQTTIIRDIFGDPVGEPWGEGEVTVKWRTIGFPQATFTASGIEVTRTGQHYDCIVCDDLNTDNNSRTPEARRKVIDHYKMLISILEPEGTLVIVGTRYAADDVIGWILDNEVGTTTGLL